MPGLILAAAFATAAPALADAVPNQPSSPPAATSADPIGAPADTVTAEAPRSPSRFFLHLSLGMNAYTYLGATGTAPSTYLAPNKSVLFFQQIGVGYHVLPSLRLQVTLQAGEAASGTKPGQSSFKVACIIPWAVYLHQAFFAGAGPMFGPRFWGQDKLEIGLFAAVGYAFPIGHTGIAVAPAAQMPITFRQRFSFSITPAIVIGDRF